MDIVRSHYPSLSLSLSPFSNKITENLTMPSSNVVKTEKLLSTYEIQQLNIKKKKSLSSLLKSKITENILALFFILRERERWGAQDLARSDLNCMKSYHILVVSSGFVSCVSVFVNKKM